MLRRGVPPTEHRSGRLLWRLSKFFDNLVSGFLRVSVRGVHGWLGRIGGDFPAGLDQLSSLCSQLARRAQGLQPLGTLRPVQAVQLKGLILAQNERWWRGLGMQVER